jgi:hypothetical protein
MSEAPAVPTTGASDLPRGQAMPKDGKGRCPYYDERTKRFRVAAAGMSETCNV